MSSRFVLPKLTNRAVIVLGGVAVAVAALALHVWLTKKRKKNLAADDALVTLQNSKTKYPLKMIEKEILTHNVRRFRFALPSPNHVLGSAVGQYVYLSATINGQMVVRPYTPVTSDDDKGYMDLVIKVYYKNMHSHYPGGGKMTQYLDGLQVGQSVDVRGPAGALKYFGKGTFLHRPDGRRPQTEYRVKSVGMIAGGTGITPMLQLLRHVIGCPEDETRLWLTFANNQEEDIIQRKELEEIAQQHQEDFRMWLTLGQPPEHGKILFGWTYDCGRINRHMIAHHIPRPSEDLLVLICGPDPMVNTCISILENLEHKQFIVC